VPKRIDLGDVGLLTFIYNSVGKRAGIDSSEFLILTEDEKVIPFQVDILVKRDVMLSPHSIDCGEIRKGRTVTSTIDIVSTLALDRKAIIARTSSKYITLDITDKPITNGTLIAGKGGETMYTLRLAVDAPNDWHSVEENVSIILKQYNGRDRAFQIPIRGSIVDPVRADVDRLFLGAVKVQREINKTILVSNIDNKSIEIVSVGPPKELAVPVKISYTESGQSISQKKLDIQFVFDSIDSKVNQFPINVLAKSGDEVYKLRIPCLFIGIDSSSSEEEGNGSIGSR
jgi:hypothetical protein